MHHIIVFLIARYTLPMLMFGMVSYLHILAAFAVILHLLLEDVPISDDVLCEMVVQSIDDRNLPPLTGKHRRRIQNQDPSNTPKRTRIQYDYKCAEASVLSDWLGEVPRFPDKQFERTFRIKCHMVDTIINHLAKKILFGSRPFVEWGRKQSTNTLNSLVP